MSRFSESHAVGSRHVASRGYHGLLQEGDEVEIVGHGDLLSTDHECYVALIFRPVLSGVELTEAAEAGNSTWHACRPDHFDSHFRAAA